MAGVGDYIHYWQSSYDKYGINKDQKSSQSASSILNQQKTKILSQVSKGVKKNYLNLQNALNRMIYPNGAYDPKAYDQYRDELEYLIGETALRSGHQFYLDGIRVMQPLNKVVEKEAVYDEETDELISPTVYDAMTTKVLNAYTIDGESNLDVVTLRQKLITDNYFPVDPELRCKFRKNRLRAVYAISKTRQCFFRCHCCCNHVEN